MFFFPKHIHISKDMTHCKCLKSIKCVFDILFTFQLVSKDKFAVLRRVCVDGKGLKITKKSWTKGLLAAAINILIGKACIVDI